MIRSLLFIIIDHIRLPYLCFRMHATEDVLSSNREGFDELAVAIDGGITRANRKDPVEWVFNYWH